MWCIKIKRKKTLWTGLLLMAVHGAFAQSYYQDPGDTLRGQAVFQDISVFNITQVHPTLDTLYFRWQRQNVDMPAGWTASICDNGHCYTELKDSGRMAAIVPGDNGLMSLHLDPGTVPGTGIIRYVLWEAGSGHNDTLTWIIRAGATTALQDPAGVKPLVYIADRQLYALQLGGAYTTAVLYSADGRLLLSGPVTGDSWRCVLPVYSSGILLLQLYGKRNFITRVLNY